MFYKVIKNNKVIDVLDCLYFVKYCPIRKRMVHSNQDEAQGIISSNQDMIWHVRGLYLIPVEGYDTVEIVEIEKEEYSQLKVLNGKTPQEIIDEYTLQLIEEGII